MDRNDRQAIEQLFDKLDSVERGGAPRDAEAEGFIQDMTARQPGASYYMAQTIVVQEQALEAAQRRIEELEAGAAAPQRASGGLLDGFFGGGRQASRGSVPRVGARPAQAPPAPFGRAAPDRASPWGSGGGHGRGGMGGGGFLAGAAQTAMGVAGGVLLGNAIAGMFDGGGGEAQAAEAADPAADPGADEAATDAGFDGGDAGLGDFGGDEF